MQKIGLEVGLNVGGLISGAAQGAGAIRELTRAMEEAEKKGDLDLYGKLGYQRDMLQANLQQFGHDTKTLERDPRIQEYNALKAQGKDTSKFTADPEFMSKIGKLNDNQEKLIAALTGVTDAIQKGDFDQIQSQVFGANSSLQEFHKSATEAATPPGAKGAADAVSTLIMQNAAGFIASSIDKYVASLDRSGIISRQGQGDIAGASIDEQRRQAGLWGGVSEAAGTGIGLALAPLTGGLSIPLGMLAGKIPGWIMNGMASSDANAEAYSKIWEQQIPGSMELNALLGKNGGTAAENTRNIRGTFSNAAGAAAEFGFSAGEGIDAVKQGAGQGLSEQDAIAAAKNVFAYERGIGADRQLALEFETRSKRFGMEDAMGWAYRGSQASGMAPGQFNEFLRSIQRVFEDGISKGFVRGTQEMAGNMAYLSTLSGGSELYKGEAGAQVMQNLNAGFERASQLSSVTDILTYRAAGNVIEKWKNSGNPEERKKYEELANIDGKDGAEFDISKLSSWEQSALLLNKGFVPELFDETMKMYQVADNYDKESLTHRIQSQFNLSDTGAIFLKEMWLKNGGISDSDYKKALELAPKNALNSDTNELDYLKLTEGFKNTMAQFGQEKFDMKLTELPGKIAEQIGKIGTGGREKADVFGKTPHEAAKIRQQEYIDTVNNPKATSEEKQEAFTAMELANQAALNPDYGIMDGNFLNGEQTRAYAGLYTQGFFGKDKADKNAKRKIDDMLASAYTSGDKNQVKNALSIRDVFSAVPQNVREDLDKNNTINALADAKSIGELIATLKTLIEASNILSDEMKKGLLMEIQ